MSRKLNLLFLFLFVFVIYVYADDGVKSETPLSNPVTVTPSGVIRGSWMETRGGRRIQAYRGIRYAEPPVGELRFQPPKLILNYTSAVVDATQDGPSCPQPTIPEDPVDEDCLRLNVYTHGKKRSKVPVILFIHPGGFYSFSGRSDLAGPHYLLERDVVFVSINYRLGTLGFLSTGDELAPGNNGFKDQVAAMRWIQRNIASFGGDPDLVTVTGYSAGSLSIGLHMVSPMSKGLFHRAISMSGSPISQIVIGSDQKYLAERQARLLDCPTGSSKEIIDCLMTKNYTEIGDSLDSMFYLPSSDPVWMWYAVVEPDLGQERFLTEQPLDTIRSGCFYAVPNIISQTRDEFFSSALTILGNQTFLDSMNKNWDREAPLAFMLPAEDSTVYKANRLKQAYLGGRDLANDTATADGLGKLYSDAGIGFPVHRMANLMIRHSPHKVFQYEFDYMGNHSFYEDPVTNKPVGVSHHDEMIYLFTLPDAEFPTIPLGSPDNTMVERLTAIWYNFARYGDPNPRGDTPELQGLSWPTMTPSERKYLRIGKEFSVHKKLFEDRYKLWDELYPIKY